MTTFMCAHVADIQIDVEIVEGCFSRGRTVFGYVLLRGQLYRGRHIVHARFRKSRVSTAINQHTYSACGGLDLPRNERKIQDQTSPCLHEYYPSAAIQTTSVKLSVVVERSELKLSHTLRIIACGRLHHASRSRFAARQTRSETPPVFAWAPMSGSRAGKDGGSEGRPTCPSGTLDIFAG